MPPGVADNFCCRSRVENDGVCKADRGRNSFESSSGVKWEEGSGFGGLFHTED